MKDYKRALRRWNQECKFEKRLRLWIPVNQYNYFGKEEVTYQELRDKVRAGEQWNFLKWTSTPCSCGGCAYLKYEREPKGKVNKKIWDDIQDDFGSVV